MRIHLEHVKFIHPEMTQSGNCEIRGTTDGSIPFVGTGFAFYLTLEQADVFAQELTAWVADRKKLKELHDHPH